MPSFPTDWVVTKYASNPVITIPAAETREQYVPAPVKLPNGDIWCYVKGESTIYAWKSTDGGETFTIQNSGNPVLSPTGVVGTGWESVAVIEPAAVYDSATDTIHLYYKGSKDASLDKWAWGHATADGDTPTVLVRDGANPILDRPAVATALGVAGGSNVDDLAISDVVVIGGAFHFFGYCLLDTDNKYRLIRAVGTTWNDPTTITELLVAATSANVVQSPSVVRVSASGPWAMFYTVGDLDYSPRSIRIARSNDGTTWDFSSTTDMVAAGSGWEDTAAYTGSILKSTTTPYDAAIPDESGRWRLYYSGLQSGSPTIARVGLAYLASECDSPISFDVYSLGTAASPALTFLATLCDAFDKSFRVELDGTGSGMFSINRSSADATAAILGDGDGAVRYVQVRIPDIDADPIFGFFIEEGDFRLLDSDEDGGETLTFKGHGSLAYLDFARMLAHSYITGGMDPYTGLWRLYQAGTGSKPGQILGRLIEEAQDADRPQLPLPLLTDTFDYTNDSNAAAWSSSDATNEFSAQIGESVLSVVGRLIGTGAITVQMSPSFVLSGYNSFGTDRSNSTFAANKVRFVAATNIVDGLTRQIKPSRVATHVLVYGEEEASVISDIASASTRVTREAYLSSTGTNTTALDAVGNADIAERRLRSESLIVRIALGADDATGLYLPGPSGSDGKFWVGDTVTLHTGTGAFDYNNTAFRVAAINFVENDGVSLVTDLEVTVELGSTQIVDGTNGDTTTISSSPGGGSSAVPPHTHPASPIVTSWKQPVRAASTGNVTVASPGATIDGVSMAVQDRVLLKDQSTASQNGIYVWLGAAVAMTRAADFTSGTMALGGTVFVSEGTVNADRIYKCTTNATITIGSTSLVFANATGSISPLTTKGDLWGYSTVDARVPVGANLTVLTADSTDAEGVSYKTLETLGHWEPLMDGASPYAPLDDGSGVDWLFVWVPG